MSDPEPFTGEPLALDLVNTRPAGGDLLRTPHALAAWLDLQAERLPEQLPAPTRSDLAAVHTVRDHITAAVEALLHGERPPEKALRGLEGVLAAAPAVRRPEWNGESVVETPRRIGEPGARLAAALADAAVDLLTDPAVERLKRCAAEDCVLVFLAAHPRRQWCSPERCGNRTRVARYYRRHKPGTS
ncbi:CGNR zinc finger domain-containing protein [Nocardia brevicatena]|uniref:CGNR zinc finger domain-containing protein n=1 Tax=Nocardia brevicatena TaxID=37327 RepID=UPI0002DEBD7A|nr:CGNR zinc finger domain-containing protein [Nocardia brevicatena]